MDPKDPVWDDDDSSPESDGFHPQSAPPRETAPAASEKPEASEAPPADPIPVPPAQGERVRMDPVDSLRRPSVGGGRTAAGSRDRRDRSSASMVVIALMLFLISVISIGVYFFSRQARDESGADGSEKVEYLDQNDQGGTSSADGGSQVQASQEATDNEAATTPPLPSRLRAMLPRLQCHAMSVSRSRLLSLLPSRPLKHPLSQLSQAPKRIWQRLSNRRRIPLQPHERIHS